ncbi:hypothetical protein RFI_01849 [Reticulomyxa filosa]|uniref:Uncharacterized protein n=1 Tax=Reticulomyxa filosa TaxID=46433 RepID=X6P9K4_RETFI|nr:hypothetical protein RFI_01849 [Reticulomyxa filosa]|eukprot:ETO35225.1 hypothetical protein RFI_01849 [Reticulomyxa filosa]
MNFSTKRTIYHIKRCFRISHYHVQRPLVFGQSNIFAAHCSYSTRAKLNKERETTVKLAVSKPEERRTQQWYKWNNWYMKVLVLSILGGCCALLVFVNKETELSKANKKWAKGLHFENEQHDLTQAKNYYLQAIECTHATYPIHLHDFGMFLWHKCSNKVGVYIIYINKYTNICTYYLRKAILYHSTNAQYHHDLMDLIASEREARKEDLKQQKEATIEAHLREMQYFLSLAAKSTEPMSQLTGIKSKAKEREEAELERLRKKRNGPLAFFWTRITKKN